MNEQLKTRFNLTDEQITELLNRIKPEIIEQALRLTKHNSIPLFKMNLKLASKYYL